MNSFVHQSKDLDVVFVLQNSSSFFQANHELDLGNSLLSNQTNESKIINVARVNSKVVIYLILVLVKHSESNLIYDPRNGNNQSKYVKKVRQKHLVPFLLDHVPVNIVYHRK